MKVMLTDVGASYVRDYMDDNQTFVEPLYGEIDEDDEDCDIIDVTLPVTICGDHVWILERDVEFVIIH